MAAVKPLGLVLAGGLARRMGGGDKARIHVGGKTILERVLARLTPQCGDWRHPVVAVWRVTLRNDLRRALLEEGLRKIEAWTARHSVAIAEWPNTPFDPFFNVNTPADAVEAERIAVEQADA